MSILTPDKSLKFHKLYYISNKGLIPLLISSFVLSKSNINENQTKVVHYLNILNFGYHSYYSTSSIITDYIKPKNLNFIARVSSLNLHGIASLGLIYFINKT